LDHWRTIARAPPLGASPSLPAVVVPETARLSWIAVAETGTPVEPPATRTSIPCWAGSTLPDSTVCDDIAVNTEGALVAANEVVAEALVPTRA
jgi:hypothetical protein